MNETKKEEDKGDDVLRRMLKTPPKTHEGNTRDDGDKKKRQPQDKPKVD